MKFTRNERILLAILFAGLFIAGNVFGYRWLVGKQNALTLSERELGADQAEAQVELQESDTWTKRKAWIHDNQPALGDEGETKAAVLQAVEKGARDNKLEVQEQNLNDVQRGPAGARVNVTVKVKGATQDIVKWLTALEKPEQFFAVTTLSMMADQDQKSMICSVQFARYFKEASQ
jgi:hypothetical protein